MAREMHFFIVLEILLVVSGCRFYYEEKLPKAPARSVELSEVSYQEVNDEVLGPRCIPCHGNSGGINLESYQKVIDNLAAVERAALIDRTMPKYGALTATEYSLLAAWIRAGAPEKAKPPTPTPTPPAPNPTPTPMPIPTPEPLKPTFLSIKENIFDRHCYDCHSPSGIASDVLFDTLEGILRSPRDLVLPRNYEDSGLYIALTREDSKRMPPGGSLKPDEIAVIKEWIEIGAPEK